MNAYRVVASEKNKIEFESFTVVTPERSEVLIETIYTTISPGIELALLQNHSSMSGIYPRNLGNSGTGRILAIGEDVQDLKVGQLVVCNMPHSSHVITESALCHPISNVVDPLEASAFRLASIALQGVRKAQIQLGESVAVLGLGPIGLLAAQLARASGATFVGGVDLIESRRQLGLACKLEATSEVAAHDAFDVVIEATGVPEVINTAFKVAKQRGRVVLLGTPSSSSLSSSPNSPSSPTAMSDGIDFYTDVHRKGLTIFGAHEINRTEFDDRLPIVDFEDEETVLSLLASERIRLRPLISEVVKAQDAARAYERLSARQEDLMLVTLNWQN